MNGIPFVPGHAANRKLDVLRDSRHTLDETGPIPIAELDRVSTPKESQKSSLKYQHEIIQSVCEHHNFVIVLHCVTVRSGKFLNKRDDIPKILNALKKGTVKGIIMKEISRTSRDVVDSIQLKRKIESAGGFLFAIKENYDSRKDTDEFLFSLHASLAQKERKTTESRVKLTQIVRAQKGLPNAATPAFGYQRNHETQKYEKHAERSKIFRFIVEKYTVDRWGIARIVKELNRRGIKTQRDAEWCYNAIKTILTNPVYLGHVIYNVTTTIRDEQGNPKLVVRPQEDWTFSENAHEPLMSLEEYELIQHIMRERKEKYYHEWVCSKKYLLSGTLYCDICGGKLYGAKMPLNDRKTKYVRYYRCQGKNGKCGKTVMLHMDQVDRLVLDMFSEIFSNKEKLLAAITTQLKDSEQEDDAQQVDELKAILAKKEQSIKMQNVAYEDGATTLAEFRERRGALRNEQNEILAQLQQYKNAMVMEQTIERASELYERIEKKLDDLYDLPFEEKADYLEAIFEKIYINADYKITNIVFNQL